PGPARSGHAHLVAGQCSRGPPRSRAEVVRRRRLDRSRAADIRQHRPGRPGSAARVRAVRADPDG
ncbi:MAG TPA: hypothetical protein VII22_11555, partial [Streptosporangiaceae bacterium]